MILSDSDAAAILDIGNKDVILNEVSGQALVLLRGPDFIIYLL